MCWRLFFPLLRSKEFHTPFSLAEFRVLRLRRRWPGMFEVIAEIVQAKIGIRGECLMAKDRWRQSAYRRMVFLA